MIITEQKPEISEKQLILTGIKDENGKLISRPAELKSYIERLQRSAAFYMEKDEIFKNEIPKSLYESAETEIIKIYNNQNGSLKEAFNTYLGNNIQSIIEKCKRETFGDITKKLDSLNFSTPGSLTDNGKTPENGIEKMSPREFETVLKRALRGDFKHKNKGEKL